VWVFRGEILPGQEEVAAIQDTRARKPRKRIQYEERTEET
jgi:hypothetical protein